MAHSPEEQQPPEHAPGEPHDAPVAAEVPPVHARQTVKDHETAAELLKRLHEGNDRPETHAAPEGGNRSQERTQSQESRHGHHHEKGFFGKVWSSVRESPVARGAKKAGKWTAMGAGGAVALGTGGLGLPAVVSGLAYVGGSVGIPGGYAISEAAWGATKFVAGLEWGVLKAIAPFVGPPLAFVGGIAGLLWGIPFILEKIQKFATSGKLELGGGGGKKAAAHGGGHGGGGGGGGGGHH